ncbi:hypothetical protein WJX74_000054 [Apatococcus lobatus]|uniref:Thioredoxin domain-containing protein n=1 Tax=Apatococcus lobatus TaxID=904363 RepID=A0AAW1RS68_9CHLO
MYMRILLTPLLLLTAVWKARSAPTQSSPDTLEVLLPHEYGSCKPYWRGETFPSRNFLVEVGTRWGMRESKKPDVPVEEALDPHSSGDTESPQTESSYSPLTEQKLQKARKQPFLSFHHASWCPFSQKLRPVIQCLSRFYSPDQLQFLALEHTHWTASKLTLSHGVTRLPSIILHDDMSPQHMSVRYYGQRDLQSLMNLISESLRLHPLADAPAAHELLDELGNTLCAAEEANVVAQDWRRLAVNPWMLLALGAILNAAVQVRMHGAKVVWWFLPSDQ